jgi:hypothetical protein
MAVRTRGRFAGTWFSVAEYAAVVEAAKAADLSVAAFLRRSTMARACGIRKRRAAKERGRIATSIVRNAVLSVKEA